MCDIRLASMWKRVSALLLDLILLAIVATGVGYVVSRIVSFDKRAEELQTCIDNYTEYYEKQFNISFDISEEDYEKLTDEEKAVYTEAQTQLSQALEADDAAQAAYRRVMTLTVLIVSIGIFFAFLLLEFAVPLLFRDGRTVGKFVFSLCIVRENSVRATPLQLFIRAILGKYAIETMIPVYIILMMFFGTITSLVALIFIGIILILQIVLMGVTKYNQALHDMLAGTVCADRESQKIFESVDALAEYKEQFAPESSNLSQAGSTEEHES